MQRIDRIEAPLASAELLAAIVESAPVAILLCDREGSIALVNREAEALFGYPRDQLLGRPVELLVPESVRSRHPALRRGFGADPRVRAMGAGRELFGQHRDGGLIPLEIALRPLRSGRHEFVLCLIADIRERKRLEGLARQTHEDLERRVSGRTAALERANHDKELLLAKLEAQRAELEHLSREDPLTRLANRRAFDQQLDGEIRRAARLASPLAAAMLDLDRFKRVNDRFGHALGDAVLREAADLIRQQCRAIDLIGRYGGEEFALALPGSDLKAGVVLCERIRGAFERCGWAQLHGDLKLTLSAGVALWRPGLDAAALLAEADAQLYQAKRSGRNAVMPKV